MPPHHHRPGSHVPAAPRAHSPAAEKAIGEAVGRAQVAHDLGQLLTPAEAMALAGPEARSKETLYSIARDVGWRENLDVDEILDALIEKFPRFR